MLYLREALLQGYDLHIKYKWVIELEHDSINATINEYPGLIKIKDLSKNQKFYSETSLKKIAANKVGFGKKIVQIRNLLLMDACIYVVDASGNVLTLKNQTGLLSLKLTPQEWNLISPEIKKFRRGHKYY